jgi:hypothetical protein
MPKLPLTPTEENRIVVFQEKSIRRTWHGGEWWFSVIDVVGMLSDSSNVRRYRSDLKRKLAQEAGSEQLYEKFVQLKLAAPDGKQRVAGNARKELEAKTGAPVISHQNYLAEPEAGEKQALQHKPNKPLKSQ